MLKKSRLHKMVETFALYIMDRLSAVVSNTLSTEKIFSCLPRGEKGRFPARPTTICPECWTAPGANSDMGIVQQNNTRKREHFTYPLLIWE